MGADEALLSELGVTARGERDVARDVIRDAALAAADEAEQRDMSPAARRSRAMALLRKAGVRYSPERVSVDQQPLPTATHSPTHMHTCAAHARTHACARNLREHSGLRRGDVRRPLTECGI